MDRIDAMKVFVAALNEGSLAGAEPEDQPSRIDNSTSPANGVDR